MDRIDLHLNSEYIKFYKEHKQKQDNEYNLLIGNLNRCCVCETKEELYIQFYNAVYRLQNLVKLQRQRLEKEEEIMTTK